MNLSDLNSDGSEGLPAIQQQEQTRDPVNGRYVPPTAAQRPQQPPSQPAEPAAPARQHSFLALQSAHALGISQDVATSMPPEALERLVATLQARQTQPERQVRPAPEPEDAIDWGEDDEGNPLTEEQAKKKYLRPIYNAIKNGHEVARLKKQLEHEQAERRAERFQGQLEQLYRSRPDLFGSRAPGDPFSAEGRRRRQVEGEIKALCDAKRQSNLEDDWTAIVKDIWGEPQPDPKPAPKPAGRNGAQNGTQPKPDPAAAYANAELAKPTARHSADTRSHRDRRIDEVAAQRREAGQYVPLQTNDDADLPAYDYDQPRR